MSDFSLALNEDQLQIQKWVHDFAEDVIRPAADEWDEREEIPWPIVEEAAKIGLYGFDFMANAMLGDPTGLTMPLAIEELFWGDAGIGLAIFGIGPGRRRHRRQRHARADRASGCRSATARPRSVAARRVLRERARRRLRRARRCAPGPSTTRPRTSGCSTARRRGSPTAASPTSTSSSPRSIPELKGRGQASFVVPPNTPGLSQGQKYKKHGIRASHTAEVVLDDVRVPGSCLLGGKEKLDEKLARAREALNKPTHAQRQAAGHGHVRGDPPGRRRAGHRHRPRRLRVRARVRQGAQGRSASRSSRTRRSRFMLADMATEIDAARLLVLARRLARPQRPYMNAEGSMSKLKAGRVAVWVTERAIQILGGYGYVREYPVERWHRDAKIYDIFEGTEQIQQLVIARAITGLRIE